MKLEPGKIFIKDVRFGETTCVKDGVLYIEKEKLQELILEDEKIKSVKIELAHPGESVRITPVKDVIEPIDNLKPYAYEKAAIMAGLKAAAYIGKCAENLVPDEITVYETNPVLSQAKEYPDLPKVGYLHMLQSHKLLHDTYYYGADAKKILPTIMYPTEILDGAIISGNCVAPCDKVTTYHHFHNPVI